ncbi:MAG: hypothetical protein AB4042_05495 [Leptolyngbyaceae cyanobacterium]
MFLPSNLTIIPIFSTVSTLIAVILDLPKNDGEMFSVSLTWVKDHLTIFSVRLRLSKDHLTMFSVRLGSEPDRLTEFSVNSNFFNAILYFFSAIL